MLKALVHPKPFCQSCSSPKSSRSSRTLCLVPRSDQRHQQVHKDSEASTRRQVLQAVSAAAFVSGLVDAQPALAVQGLTAGRIPGLSNPDSNGIQTYIRPEGKSGGHGVGWSEIPRYTFKVPKGWEETPVSIADLGGTEIDLRFTNKDQGSLAVVVAPLLRFIDVGFNADVRIEEVGPPEKLISGFAPELFGSPLSEDDVIGHDS